MTNGLEYSGDLDVETVWKALSADPNAVLVDVRTVAEWNFVGIPDLSSLSKRVLLIEWQSFPTMNQNGKFLAELADGLAERGLGKDAAVYFICRSGARSKSAAIAATSDGHTAAFNVAEGFEGPLDPERHRGGVGGWKAAGLPWIQS
ncbi:rhodanese-like domain-containing protein [Oryzibacter oryziterrae]|uniref:rhodanese-like domain-containing protein n=1 Tax=Oryzibacter oryziterrae TaxID=2766474 RepID=UPI001F30EC8A|nr:rhodanese-like domain-containing protein [Oryzibacter oryziterrae]